MAQKLDEAAAIALVSSSRLFDQEWYAACSGLSFGSRVEAVEHWVRDGAPDLSPHPLFEPQWLYPQERWRAAAPDPLSFYLSRPAARGRTPHPCYPMSDLGPLEDWLAEHSASEVLGVALERAAIGQLSVVLPGDDLPAAIAWLRHLSRHDPEATVLVAATSVAARRVLCAVAASLPMVRVVERPVVSSPLRVDILAGVAPPRWSWLRDLVAALDEPGVASAQPLFVSEDFTVAAAGLVDGEPFLHGHPIADAVRVGGLALPAPWPGVLASRVGAEGATVLASGSRVPATVSPGARRNLSTVGQDNTSEALWRAAGFDSPGRPITVREGRRALRWSLDIAAGAGPIGTRWGDFHFAMSLASALDRLGQWVAIEHPETRERASRELDDVTVTIRGLERVTPPATSTNLLWVISHPDEVSAEEASGYDALFAASTTWAADRTREWGRLVEPLLQCTDPNRFHPGLGEPDTGRGALFVANARQTYRPTVQAAVETGLPLTVYGAGWEEWLPAGRVTLAGDRIDNAALGAVYAGADLVLNDHWDDMRLEGFVSNRVFDVLATGARLLCDDVAGLVDVVGDVVPTWSTTEDFARLTGAGFESHYPDAAARLAVAERVVVDHSFDARAATLLDTAYGLLDSRP